MCGFVVAVQKDNKKFSDIQITKFKQASNSIRHRGPDSSNEIFFNNVLLSFHRLSIIDLSRSGEQPFFSDCRMKILLFNGEIYNFKELKLNLLSRGQQFKTNTDTEVLFHLLVEFGEAALNMLRGMFSFVFIDREENKIICARDRIGIKPLYLHETDDVLYLASEIKPLKLLLTNKATENQHVSLRYLFNGFCNDIGETFYKDISPFPPSQYLILSNGAKTYHKYWDLDIFSGSNREFDKEEFRDVFQEVIKLHSISDVPVCFALSGGIDSASLVSVSNNLNLFSGGLLSYTTIPSDTFDESPFVDRLVKDLDIKQNYVNCDLMLSEFVNLVDKLVLAHEEPIQKSSALYHFLLRKQASEDGCKVMMVGEGADELLAGYRRMIFPYLFELRNVLTKNDMQVIMQGGSQLMGVSLAEFKERYLIFCQNLSSNKSGRENNSWNDLFDKEYVDRFPQILSESMYPGFSSSYNKNNFHNFLLNKLTRRNVPYVLRMEDINSMMVGMESRVPFLDHKFVEYVMSHKVSCFMNNGLNKAMLRSSMAGIVPSYILARKTKSNRPGSANFIFKNYLYIILKEYLPSLKIGLEFIDKSIDLERMLDTDFSDLRPARAEFWFRLYVYLRWKELCI
jgi:asparagine synthase (glutamine-hydrolysing)